MAHLIVGMTCVHLVFGVISYLTFLVVLQYFLVSFGPKTNFFHSLFKCIQFPSQIFLNGFFVTVYPS